MIRNAFSLLALFCFLCSSQASQPRVKVDYSPQQDLLCSSPPASSIKDEWKAEMLSRRPEFEKLWKAEGPRLLAATEAISGREFPPQEVTDRLTLCNAPSESFPGTDRVTINMRYALRSFTPEPVSMRYKVYTLFHELLHSFVVENLPESTPLLKKYAAEAPKVLSHLHLFAIEKLVYTRLGRAEDLAWLDFLNKRIGDEYGRAWEIVDHIEGYEKFVAEFPTAQ